MVEKNFDQIVNKLFSLRQEENSDASEKGFFFLFSSRTNVYLFDIIMILGKLRQWDQLKS
jgi:hypothetical protein